MIEQLPQKETNLRTRPTKVVAVFEEELLIRYKSNEATKRHLAIDDDDNINLE